MLVEIGADFIPVVFLTTGTQDASSDGAVEVEGQEVLAVEASEEAASEAGAEVTASAADEATSAESEIETETEASDVAADTESVEGEEAVDGETAEGEVATDEEVISGDAGVVEGDSTESGDVYSEEMMGGSMAMTEDTAKDPLLSSPVFVGGISLGVLVVGGVLGFILAKKKIKKGIEIYEDI